MTMQKNPKVCTLIYILFKPFHSSIGINFATPYDGFYLFYRENEMQHTTLSVLWFQVLFLPSSILSKIHTQKVINRLLNSFDQVFRKPLS